MEGMGLTNNATVQTQTENNLQEEDEWILLDDVSSEKSEKNDIQSSEEKLDKLLHDIDLLWDICVENKEKLGKIEGKIYESIASEVSSLPSDFLLDTPQIDFQILILRPTLLTTKYNYRTRFGEGGKLFERTK